jgi:type IV pilus assembly protein PilW
LDNTVGMETPAGFASNQDMGLVTQPGVTDCLLEEVNTVAPPTLNLGGVTYYTPIGTTTNLATLATSTSSYFTPLGNAGINDVQFELIGVGANRTLYSYDLFQNLNRVQASGGDVAQAIADGVEQLHAIYGIDTTGTGKLGGWADPADPGYDIATVMATPATMQKIIAVRVALVVRGEYYDKNMPALPGTVTIFNNFTSVMTGASLQQTIATAPHYRYRVFEFTVPLRNMLLLAGAGA